MKTLMFLIALGAAPSAFADLLGAEAFEQMKVVVGQWQGVSEGGRSLRIDYATTARGSVLVETWQPGTKAETLSVMHQDGDQVMATHYCGQGNQPRLVMKSSDGKRFVFEYQDASNLGDPDASHLHRLEFASRADGSLDRIETYRSGAETETSRVHLTRLENVPAEEPNGP